jgi:L-alanine-DL-glutamate epimerase-like enolase superfamily enzyme
MYEVDMAHHEEPQVSAHLLGSIPHGTYVEAFDPDRDPVFWSMFANRSDFVDGDYIVPTGAGFGLELDHDFIDKHRVDAA